jgi:hypothetical protein
MLTNSYGFPLLEGDDYASPAALARLASIADQRFFEQETFIDGLERPEAIVLKLPSNQVVGAGSNQLNFNTTVYQSRTGAFATFGINFGSDVWRPGIYHSGVYCQVINSGTVNSVTMDLHLQDRRGPRLLNDYSEEERTAEGSTARGAIDLSIDRMFEVHKTAATYLAVYMGVVGGGTVSVSASASRFWAYRVRGL